MEFLIAAGTGIVKRVVEYTVEPVVRQVSYLTHSKSKLQKLKTKVEDLVAIREGVQHDIDQAVRKGKRIETVVENWKTRVDVMTGEANKFLKDERHAKTKCLYGFCPNLILRYRISRESTKLLDKVVKLYAEKEFPNFSYNVPPQEVCSIYTREYTTSDSRISTVKEIMDELSNPDTDMILVYGIAGVGKTTLAEDVLRKAIEDKVFDDVVMVRDVKENPDLGKIQKEIATKLGLEVLENQTLFERAPFLCDRIKDKKTLVILDDVWEALDLVAMGLPRVVTCKILMTCRSRKELSLDSRKQKVFHLDILGEKDAWSLFEKMTGDIVKEDIRNIATQVAKRCGGLPLLVVTVARSLKYRTTLPPWKDALRRLKGIDNEELTRKAYLALEWSYNQLDEEELKPLFLLCASVLIGNSVNLSRLLKYGMGFGLFKNVETIEEAKNALYSLVEKLKDFGLLLDDNDNIRIRMHDLVRDVARSIASRVAFGGELKEWPTNDFLEKCSCITLLHRPTLRLPDVLQCPELRLFRFRGTRSSRNYVMQDFLSNFFQETIKLKVLDLTGVSLFPSLPPSLQFLKNLRTLCLDSCELGDISLVGHLGSLEILSFLKSKVKSLPKEIGKLTHLRLLDLTNCLDLEVISPNVISSLKRLEDLRMRNSFKQWEDERIMGERRNASISELKHLSHLTALQIHIPDANSLPADLFSNKCLESYHISIGGSDIWKDMVYKASTLNTLNLKLSISNDLNSGLQMLLEKSEVLCMDGTDGTVKEGFLQQTHLHIINSKVQLSNLRTLEVHQCDGKFLLSSSTARRLIQLKHLKIWGCPLLEGIVSTKDLSERNDTDIMFRKLEHVELKHLPNLARFCSGNYIEFPSLQILKLKKCAKLGAFISDPVSENNIICNEIEQVDSKEKSSLDDKITVSLFDEKVKLPRLKRLYVEELPKLMAIWHNQLPQDFDLHNLNSVVIRRCDSLKNVFPASSVVRGLQQLEKMEVSGCNEMEEIVTKEAGVESSPPEFVFPKVTSMEFSELRKVRNFYPGVHVLKVPLLNHLKLTNIGAEENHENHQSASQNLSLFLIQKHSFPNLDSLTLSGGKIWSDVVAAPAELFSKLKSVCFNGWSPFSDQDAAALFFLEKLPNLGKIEERSDRDVEKGNGSGSRETHAVVPLPGVTTLKLSFLHSLVNLGGNHNSQQAAGPFLPNLETLDVFACSRLKNLESSAVSFRNLIRLDVYSCDKMRYLTTYEVATSLVQVTTLQVDSCEVMTEIIVVSSNQDDDGGNENVGGIAFKRLQRLRVTRLPKLQGFCSGRNCIVKFPSLQTLYISKRLNKLKIVPHHDQTVRITEIEDRPLKGNMDNEDNTLDSWKRSLMNNSLGMLKDNDTLGRHKVYSILWLIKICLRLPTSEAPFSTLKEQLNFICYEDTFFSLALENQFQIQPKLLLRSHRFHIGCCIGLVLYILV